MSHIQKNIAKSEIIETLAHKFRLSERQSKEAVSVILDTMTHALASGDRIEVRGFGSFEVRKREARTTRNPKTGERVNIGAQYKPHFKAGAVLREKINAYVDEK
jgi:integration host factor subunit beta